MQTKLAQKQLGALRVKGAVERVASLIAEVERVRSIAVACEIGAVIVRELYAGDAAGVDAHGGKAEPLRRLAAHPAFTLNQHGGLRIAAGERAP